MFAPFLLLLACASLSATEKVAELQDRFDHDAHVESKIKTLDKLGQAQFDAASKADQAGDYTTVGFILEKYRDNVRASFDLLKKEEPDPDRYGNTYRHLELQVRRGVREVQETLAVVPDPLRPPLEIVHQDLLSIDDELIRLLFPRRSKEVPKVPNPPEAKP